MKKNKKYWKKEAKGWKEVAQIESEEANNWAARALDAEAELETLKTKKPVISWSGYNPWVNPTASIKSNSCKCKNCDC